MTASSRTVLVTALVLLTTACGRTWSESGFAQVESAARAQGMTEAQAACVRLQVENIIPAEQFATNTGQEKLAAILEDCQDGQPSDERTALGWWWDFINYDVLGGEPLLTYAVGWEVFLVGAPIMAPIALVQLIF